jgi:hypothetical protein
MALTKSGRTAPFGFSHKQLDVTGNRIRPDQTWKTPLQGVVYLQCASNRDRPLKSHGTGSLDFHSGGADP